MSEEKNVCEKSARVTQRLKARKIWIGAKAKRRSKGAMCTRDNEAVLKVAAGCSHQNANAVWDIYCRVLMQFKTGSLSRSPSASPCRAPINQPLKADVT